MRIPAFLIFLSLSFLIGNRLSAQGCPGSSPSTTIELHCGERCTNVTLSIPDLRETSDYLVQEIPYNPYPFVTSAPAVDFRSGTAWPGNSYSLVQPLGFNFCFYEATVNKLVIGANGCISFDTTMAGRICNPRLTANNRPTPLPSNTYARGLIAGVLHDLDPLDTARVSPNDKVEFRVEGPPGCRRAIISYFEVPMWPQITGTCTTKLHTSQIVLYEGTGIIEIFVRDNDPCTSAEGGRSTLGIQNFYFDKAASTRDMNAEVWGSQGMNKGYRFLPYGGSPRYQISVLSLLGYVPPIGQTAATPGAPGYLNVTFNNLCPPEQFNTYLITSRYSGCNGGPNYIFYDSVFVNKPSSLTATVASYPAHCSNSDGSLVVNIPPGVGTPPFQYSINNGPPQSSNVFTNLPAGLYEIMVEDQGPCPFYITQTVGQLDRIDATTSVTNATCNGVNNGTIQVIPQTGTAPFQYSINSGPLQSIPLFGNLAPGNYTVTTVDANGCAISLQVIIAATRVIQASAATTSSACAANTGSITVTASNGTPPYQYSLDNGPYQPSNTFNNLGAGNYLVSVRDASGCLLSGMPVVVQSSNPLSASIVKTDASCYGGADGSVTVSISNGAPPFEYSIDGINYSATNIFQGLTAGNYVAYYRDDNLCYGIEPFTIAQPDSISISTATESVSCNGGSDGNITVSASGGTGVYQYSLDNINYQASPALSAAAGTHTVYVRDANGCTKQVRVNVFEPSPLQATATTRDARCNGAGDGQITVTAIGGNTNYSYSLDGTNYQPSNIFNVIPGVYQVYVRDGKNCVFDFPVTVGYADTFKITASADTTICPGQPVNLQATGPASQYSWSPATGLNDPQISNPVATPLVYTNYIVTGTDGVCIATDSVAITVLNAPVPNAGADANICNPGTTRLSGSGGVFYEWSPASSLDDPTKFNPVASPSVTTQYLLHVRGANGCRSIIPDTAIVYVADPINIVTTTDTVVFAGDVFRLFASGGTSYLWSPSAGLDDASSQTPQVTVTNDITYSVIVSNGPCSATGSVRITVFQGPELYVPNAFTPNNDGLNDIFRAFPVGIKTLEYFRVYNRWGQLVFSTTTLNRGWDGSFGGRPQPSDVYVWIVRGVTKDDEVIYKKGTVTLVR